jgi:hypothetical protein
MRPEELADKFAHIAGQTKSSGAGEAGTLINGTSGAEQMRALAVDSWRAARDGTGRAGQGFRLGPISKGRIALHLNRRQLLAVGFGTSLLFPLEACVGQVPGQQFTPEAYGAVGDGLTDDYDALLRLTKAVSAAKGGTVTFAPGRTYFVNRYVTAASRPEDLIFASCDGLVINGSGATIAVKGDFNRDQPTTRGLAGLKFQNCRNVSVRSLNLDGNVHRMTRVGRIGETPSHGLIFRGCTDVTIDGVVVRRFPTDGLYIAEGTIVGPSSVSAACRRFTVRNSMFLFNARQGLSVIQLRGAVFENCDFSHTGFVAPATRGPYGSHSPAAGVDVEPNNTTLLNNRVDVLTGEIVFSGCRMVGNVGSSFVAGKFAKGQRFLEQVALRSCYLACVQGEQGSRYGFIFDVAGGEVTGCTLQLYDKTAFLGWYAQSDASFRFVGNTVYGRNPGRGRPLITVRPTKGVPVIEQNRLIAEGGSPLGEAAKPWLINVANPNAIVRDNQLSVSAAPFLG